MNIYVSEIQFLLNEDSEYGIGIFASEDLVSTFADVIINTELEISDFLNHVMCANMLPNMDTTLKKFKECEYDIVDGLIVYKKNIEVAVYKRIDEYKEGCKVLKNKYGTFYFELLSETFYFDTVGDDRENTVANLRKGFSDMVESVKQREKLELSEIKERKVKSYKITLESSLNKKELKDLIAFDISSFAKLSGIESIDE